jgi:tRNA threonylcarbamoyladenosine biosynthesis protein TsaB
MRVIAFDTAGPVIGVAAADGERVAARALRVARGTEGVLPGLVTAVLESLGLRLADLQGVVVAEGPGAFTGLRVGMAAATALALARGVPVVAVDALTPRALRAGAGGPTLALLDARKGRVYAAAWDAAGFRTHEPVDVAPEVAAAFPGGPFRATGEGAVVYRAVVEAAGGSVVADADDPGVGALAVEGARRLAGGDGRDPALVVPRYVRAPDVGA